MTLRIHLWSGPRNVSTALMYSFAQRADTRVVDEPLYAHFLRVSGVAHPGRDEVLRAQDNDGARVVRERLFGPCDRPVQFVKQMAHHLVDLDRWFLRDCANVVLTRDPRDMLPSLVNQVPDPTLRDTAYAMQTQLVRELRARNQPVVVLDSRELLVDPATIPSRIARSRFSPTAPRAIWCAGSR